MTQCKRYLAMIFALLENNEITKDDLLLPYSDRKPIAASNSTASEKFANEKERIVDALNQARWNRKEAAEQLGLTYRQLRYRIKQLGIDAEQG